MVKNPPCNAGDSGDTDPFSGWETSISTCSGATKLLHHNWRKIPYNLEVPMHHTQKIMFCVRCFVQCIKSMK